MLFGKSHFLLNLLIQDRGEFLSEITYVYIRIFNIRGNKWPHVFAPDSPIDRILKYNKQISLKFQICKINFENLSKI